MILAQSDPSKPEDDLSLAYLSGGYSPSQAVDYINAADSYAADAQRMQAMPLYANRVYGRAKVIGTRTVLQYWFFYYFNWHPFASNVGDHEGDWEMVQYELDTNGSVLRASYSQHGTGENCPWSFVERSAVGRPTVYVARGSHASYFKSGPKPLLSASPAGDAADGDDTPITPSVVDWGTVPPGWVTWPGQWGSSTSGSFQSPRSPGGQGTKWTSASAWADTVDGCWEALGFRPNSVQASGSHSLSRITQPPAPKIRATRVGKRVRVAYSFRVWPSNHARRPVVLLTSVKSSGTRFAPYMKRHGISTRTGVVYQPLGLGRAPFTLYAAAYSRQGASSASVKVRVSNG